MDATGTNSSFPSTFRANSGALAGAGIGRITSVAVRVAGSLVHSLFTCAFATVGAVLGSIAGGVIGLVSETGFVRGTVIGVISGALVSMEVVESSVAIWHSDEYTIWQMFVVIWSLLTNRLMRGKVFPVMRSAMDIEMNATDAPMREESDIFNASGTTGMRRVAIDRLPVTKFTEHDIMDVRGRQITCSVCLHNFEVGESARSLPQCCHVFHLSCIDSWLLCHASCPLCRRAV